MATVSTPGDRPSVIHHEEPPRKAPPLLEVGAVHWIRENLFRSWFDTLLTILSSLFVVSTLTSLLQWSLNWANWYVILNNFDQFMAGRYENQAEWRVQLLVALVAFAAGISAAAWARLPRLLATLVVVALVLAFVLPPVIDALIPLPASYLAAGSTPVVSGTATQMPLPQLAFLGRQGERVAVRLALEQATTDETLGLLHGFVDNAANTLRNAAANRLTSQARLAEIEALLQGDLLTGRQRARLEEEKGKIEVPPPVTDTFAVNQPAVNVRLLRGTTLEVVGEARLDPQSTALETTLPEDGWYVLEKTVEGDAGGVALLQTEGIYPLVEYSLTRTQTGEGGATTIGRFSQFVRMTDGYLTEEPRPKVNDANVPMATSVENQYRGERPFADYLRLFLSPFLGMVNVAFLVIVVAAAAGYYAGRLADQYLSPREKPRRASRRVATWLLTALPLVMFVLVMGLIDYSAADVGNLIGSAGWLAVMFFVGLNYRKAVGPFLLVGGLFLAFIQPHIPALVWSASSVNLDAVVNLVGPWLLVMAAGTALAVYGDPWRSAIPYIYRELGLVVALVVWGLALVVAPPLLAGLVNAGTLDAGFARTLVDLSRVVAYVAWFAAMFFIGRQWGLLGLGAGLLLFTCQWLNHVGYSTPENAIAIGWLGAGLYAASVGAQREQSFTERAQRRGLALSALVWLAILALVPLFFHFSVSQSWTPAASAENLMPVTDPQRWGGLLLTVLLTVVGIVGSFPIGILLALGRRSQLPVVRVGCTLFIEVVRGVPLITVLFMGALILPLANPALAGPDTQAYRAMVAIVLFSAAYLAENVRGGLQSIPHGQEEAARAIGLHNWQITLYITLPQALRAVIPALVGQFISLFKDTSLVAIVGLMDLTKIADDVASQPEFLGLQRESYIFIAVIYFVFSYGMSFVSRRLERSGVGTARKF